MATDWKEREKIEAENRVKFLTLTICIAAELGGKMQDDDGFGRHINLENGEQIYLSYYSRDKNRFNISGSFPRRFDGSTMSASSLCKYNEATGNEITCSMARKAKDIARDIKTRLLPRYRQLLAIAIEHNRVEKENFENRELASLAIMQVLGDTSKISCNSSKHEREVYGKGSSFKLRYDGFQADIKLHNIPVAKALRIAAIMAEF